MRRGRPKFDFLSVEAGVANPLSLSSVPSGSAPPSNPPAVAHALTFTEFVRVNMRLAEDRILSFVSVFSTGLGTKWITGSTFFYTPEIKFQSLLAQR